MLRNDPTCPATSTHGGNVAGTQTFEPRPHHLHRAGPASELAIQRGTRIDRYVVEERLGAGGMGVVYAATDLDLDRRVAIKIVRDASHAHADERHARLLREARAMALLDHPNVVRIFEAGTTLIGDREHAFIAMELVDGAALGTWAVARPWRERLRALIDAGRGLAAAHAAGLVHRDVKPENILVDRTGRARVGDLGLASMTRAAGAVVPGPCPADGLTHTEAIMGTPAFMAPEQHRGEPADGRTDQFGFCVTAWLVLYGQHPFELADLPAAVLTGAVRPPPRGDVPGWVEPLLRAGLATAPARRHPSLAAMLDAFDRRLRPRRRWPALVALAAVAALAAPFWLGAGEARSAVAPPTCPGPALPALHVDAAASPGGTGAAGCPFRTITEALAVDAPTRVIHVAAGRYDAAHGEVLPLVVRGTTAVRGAGADVTVIAGLGLFDPRPDAVAFSRFPLRATMVIGDETGAIEVTGVGIEGGQAAVVDGSIGVLCTRGNLDSFVGPIPAPNTRLEHVVIGHGYETGVVVSGGLAPRLTGCNLAISAGIIHDATVGVWQMGCGQGHGAAPTGLAVADSTFRGLRGAAPPTLGGRSGFGVLVWDCARRTRIEANQFTQSEHGVYLVRHDILRDGGAQHDPAGPPALIAGNEFAGLGRHGVYLERAVHVELQGNRFHGNPSAVTIYATTHEPPRVRARGNAFFGNQVAVEVRGLEVIPRRSVIDLGRADDAGDNTFNCNAERRDPPAATVTFRLPAAPGASLGLAGNGAWMKPPVWPGNGVWRARRFSTNA